MAKYASGTWIGMISPSGAVVVPPGTDQAVLDRLWGLLEVSSSLPELLDALLSGTQVGAMSDFAIVRTEADQARIAVRGPLDVTVFTPTDERTISSDGLLSWREESVPTDAGIVVARRGSPQMPMFTIGAGVVFVSRVAIGAVDPGEVRLPRAPQFDRQAAPEMPRTPGLPAEPDSSAAAELEPESVPADEPQRAISLRAGDEVSDNGPAEDVSDGAVRPSEPRSGRDPAAGDQVDEPGQPSGLTTLLAPETLWAVQPEAGEVEGQPVLGERDAEESGQYDYLFDDPTRLADAEEAAVRLTEEDADGEGDTDHDGLTILRNALAAPGSGEWDDHDGHTVMRVSDQGSVGAAAAGSPSAEGPTVLARLCPGCGRASPSWRANCGGCAAPLGGDAVVIPRPILGVVAISNGERIELDRPVVIGSKPRSPRFSSGDVPRLVTAHGPNEHVSRSHLRIDFDDWRVMVSDLGSTNGTILRRDGQPDRRLRQAEPVLAIPGDVFVLGDEVHVTVVELP